MLETTGARRFWQIRPQDESAGATYPEQRLSLCEFYCFLRLLQSPNLKKKRGHLISAKIDLTKFEKHNIARTFLLY